MKESSTSSPTAPAEPEPPREAFPVHLRVGRAILTVLFRCYFRVGVEHPEHVPVRGPVIVAGNHQSFLDPMMVGLRIPRPAVYLARQTLFRNRIFGAFIRFYGAAPLDREGTGLGALRAAVSLLEQDRLVVLFPEGTRTSDGSVGRFRPGVGLLALKTRAPVVPVGISGAAAAFGRHRRFPRPGRISVRFGAPLRPGEGESARAFTDRLREAVSALAGAPS